MILESLNISLPLQYGIVIDSGSSRSTVYVYEWPGEKENETGVVTEKINCRVEGESWLFVRGEERQTKVCSHRPRQKVPVCLICMCLEARVLRENTQWHKENMQTLRRKARVESEPVAAPAVAKMK